MGGEEAIENEFPMMAAIKHDDYRNIVCGATIVNNFFAVTAAHCVVPDLMEFFELIVGEHNVTVKGI